MTLLTPLGLLALISLIILLIIYIIRPNFQQRVISSTYIWKLSLKYKKKRVPVSKLRNLLLIICQVLILACCALVLSQPNKILMAKESGEEAIIIIDASASMRIEKQYDDGSRESRFERAVTDAIDLADDTFRKEGKVSVIIADDSPEFLIANRLTYTSANSLYSALRALLDDEYACSYGTSDIDGALSLCEDIILVNNDTQVFLYTDIKYPNVPAGINVMNEYCVDESEWNVAILNAYTVYEDNYYNYYVEVASYGQSFANLNLKLEVNGVNDSQDTYTRMADSDKIYLEEGTVYTIAFRHTALSSDIIPPDTLIIQDLGSYIYSFESVYVSIVDDNNKNIAQIFAEDGLFEDNEFYIYGGKTTPLKVQYVSSYPNPFINGALNALRSYYAGSWDITIESSSFTDHASFTGYDLYIWEHAQLPAALPSDGVSLVIAPESNISGSRVTTNTRLVNVTVSGGVSPSKAVEHPLLEGLNLENIYINRYVKVVTYDEDTYTSIATLSGSPLILVANDAQFKAVYFNFDLHYSNLPLLTDFPLFMYNLFEYYFPAMIDANSYEVNETVTMRGRGDSISVKGGDYAETFKEFPAKASFSVPGTYTLTQDTFGIDQLTGEALTVTENIYVRLPESESIAHFEADTAPLNPYTEGAITDFYEDLLFYIAIAMTALMFAEWLLQIRDNM